MTLDELKKRATAAELTLIEATEAATRKAVISEVKKSVLTFILENTPPSPERGFGGRGDFQSWFERLGKHINPEES